MKGLPAASPDAVAAEAELAGLVAVGPAPIASLVTSRSANYRAGFLAGHLIGTLIRSGRPVTDSIVAVASRYAATLASEEFRSDLDGATPDTVPDVHSRAWLQSQPELDPTHADVRHAALQWLEKGLGIVSSAGPRVANELWWQACDGIAIPGAEPGKPTKVSARATRAGSVPSAGVGRVVISMAFLISEESWQMAASHRLDGSTDPLTDPALNGLFELCVDEARLFRTESTSIASIACQLSHARASGFPETLPTCAVEGASGSWRLEFKQDPVARQILITDMNSGATGRAGVAVVSMVMSQFARTFAIRAARHIPDMTNWGGLVVLGESLATKPDPQLVLRTPLYGVSNRHVRPRSAVE
jgi:hypothetical protein